MDVYESPDITLQTEDITTLLNCYHNAIIAGDLNAIHCNWNSRKNNPAGNALFRLIDSRNDVTVIAPSTPLHYSTNLNHNPNIHDVAILKTKQIGYHMDNYSN